MTNLRNLFDQCNIHRLPIELTKICEKLEINLTTYQDYAQFSGMGEDEICRHFYSDGFTLSAGRRKIIVYNQNQPNLLRRRFTIGHELGHILLGHLSDKRNTALDLGLLNDRMADHFAANLLCPLPVLHMMGVQHPQEIQELCQVSQAVGEICWRKLEARRSEENFLLTEEEKELIGLFFGYISEYHSRQAKKSPFNLKADRLMVMTNRGI